jgi:hypothetical protein
MHLANKNNYIKETSDDGGSSNCVVNTADLSFSVIEVVLLTDIFFQGAGPPGIDSLLREKFFGSSLSSDGL